MKKLKVLTVVGTRPEIIRLSCVLQKLDASEAIEHILVHTGQNYDYELNEVHRGRPMGGMRGGEGRHGHGDHHGGMRGAEGRPGPAPTPAPAK